MVYNWNMVEIVLSGCFQHTRYTMEKILVEDLIQYKMLPFDLYNDRGIKLISAGEILTSGKLLRVSQYDVLYKENPKPTKKLPQKKETQNLPSETTINTTETDVSNEKTKPDTDEEIHIPEIVTPILDEEGNIITPDTAQPEDKQEQKIEEDDEETDDVLDLLRRDDVVNNTSKLPPESQVSMKTHYVSSMSSLKEKHNKEAIEKINEMKSKILTEVGTIIDEVKFCSQLKLLGDYYNCHALNTAILATALGYKLEFDSEKIENLTQSALLHDIGMTKFPPELLNKTKLSNKECKLLEKHTIIGFKILKDEMKMPEEICLVALEHHENNDGSGYPYGISGDQISEMSRIVGLCSLFDDLTSNKTKYKIKNTKDALRAMLEFGSHRFPPELLYKFVNMFKYNDLNTFDDMVR